MTATIIDDPLLRNRIGVFEDRNYAGVHLAKALAQFRGKDAIVLAIPSGGVPVGVIVSSQLELPFDLLIIRKIPIPGLSESGFGAVSLEGDLVLNQPLVRSLGLSAEEIEELARPVREELRTRNRIFRQDRPWPELEGRTVILVDDGLASGYTMLAAVKMVRRRSPGQVVIAVPTGSASTIELLSPHADWIICPNIRSGYSFAVADAYRNWYDLSREEVVGLMKSAGSVG